MSLKARPRTGDGFSHLRDSTFDGVRTLWDRRRESGIKQSEVAKAIGRDQGWVSRNLRTPANWTLRTVAELAEALDGDVEIIIHAREDSEARFANSDA